MSRTWSTDVADYDVPIESSQLGVPNIGDLKGKDILERSTLYAMENNLRTAAAEMVPWFIDNMPAAYFRNIPESQRLRHLQVCGWPLVGDGHQEGN